MTTPQTMNLPVVLDDVALLDRARRKAALERELRELEDKNTDAKREMSAEEKRLQRKIEDLGRVVDDGKELQPVVVIHRRTADGHHVETIRTDSGQVVETRFADLEDRTRAEPGGNLIDQAAAAQREAGIFEDDDGEVVPPEGNGGSKRRRKGGAA